MIHTYLSVLLFSCLFGFGDHDFHLSKCEINYKSEQQSIQISLHIFIDDLELGLEQLGADSLYVGTEKEEEDADSYIGKYINRSLKINSDGMDLQPTYLGKELSADLMAVWCYLEISDVASCDDLLITNKLLTELYDDQKNIVAFDSDIGTKQYFIFDQVDKTKSFSCE